MDTLSRPALQLIAGRFKLLSSPTRLGILQHICEQERTVTELIALTGFKQANVSRQLGLLRAGGLVTRRVDGNCAYFLVVDDMLPKLCELMTDSMRKRQIESAAHLARPSAG